MSALVALGDSFTCGEGVGVRIPMSQTWTSLLAGATGLRPISLATAGARVGDLRRRQVHRVPDADVATVLAGLNDVARSGFAPAVIRDDLLASVEALRPRVRTIIVCRLHDPFRLVWVPRRVRRAGRQRVAVVNAAVDEAARMRGVVLIDLASVPGLADARGWAVDRVHPSPGGHAAIAAAAADALGERGYSTQPVHVTPCRAPSATAHAAWLIRHAAPYFAGRISTFAVSPFPSRRAPTGGT